MFIHHALPDARNAIHICHWTVAMRKSNSLELLVDLRPNVKICGGSELGCWYWYYWDKVGMWAIGAGEEKSWQKRSPGRWVASTLEWGKIEQLITAIPMRNPTTKHQSLPSLII